MARAFEAAHWLSRLAGLGRRGAWMEDEKVYEVACAVWFLAASC